jgi:hypothetical protein
MGKTVMGAVDGVAPMVVEEAFRADHPGYLGIAFDVTALTFNAVWPTRPVTGCSAKPSSQRRDSSQPALSASGRSDRIAAASSASASPTRRRAPPVRSNG